jgi:branched-chain amino acid transport system permease protein
VGLPFWLAFLAALVVMVLFGMALERLVLRPLLGQPAFTVVMVTIGVGYLARGLVTMIPDWGTDTHSCRCPTRTKSSARRQGQGAGGLGGTPRHHRRHRGC